MMSGGVERNVEIGEQYHQGAIGLATRASFVCSLLAELSESTVHPQHMSCGTIRPENARFTPVTMPMHPLAA